MNGAFDPFPWIALILLLILAVGTLKARRRLRALPRLAVADTPIAVAGDYRWVTATGVAPDDALTAKAIAYARREGLLALDLVPGDLSVEPLLDLLNEVDPAAFRHDPVANGRGGCHALLVHETVLARAGIADRDGVAPVRMLEVTRLVKRYAPRETGHAVAPELRSVAPDPRAYKAHVRALGAPPAAALAGLIGQTGAFLGAIYTTPVWGLAALGVWWAQPFVVLAGRRPVAPRGAVRDILLRPFLAVWRFALAVTGPAAPPAHAAELAASRKAYAADVAGGTERFLEPRRETCPWCESERLAVRLRTKDRLQGKPGRFTLERCRDCGHTFQNPRLSVAGLDYYYRDFYDGLGESGAEAMFATMSRQYLGRARLVAAHARPNRWLDVGTGHAHMCLVAKSVLPDTEFDGLDMGDAVVEGERRGWIGRAYVGQFPDHANHLAGSYDLVSMHHYLEHVRDPFAELDAAAKVVRPGGHLLIELPDPQSWYARLLGRRWHPWFQPQHQHMMPLGNLTEALAARGFTVVTGEHGPAHQGGLFVAAVTHSLTAVAPDPGKPWYPHRATWWRRGRRVAAVVVLVPVYAVAGLLDAVGAVVAGTLGRAGGSDAYRLLARKEPG